MPDPPRTERVAFASHSSESNPADVETRTATWGRSQVRERAAPLAPDTCLGRYRIVGLLGSGGLGNVYRAHDPALARDIALKILHQRFDADERETARHRRLLLEGQALAKLSHANVVTVYDVGAQGDVVFIAMALVDGQSLDVWLDARPSRDDVLRVLIAAGRGLAAAHAAGVIHGDFKPANVMLSRDGQVRIVDFGLARTIRDDAAGEGAARSGPAVGPEPGAALAPAAEEDPARRTALRGTPGYIAPELLRGEGSADIQADQYSFAVTAFVALTGKLPYAGQTLSEYHRSLTSEQRGAWPAGVPRRLCRVVERGMALSPGDRYPDLDALLDALEAVAKPRRRGGVWVALSLTGLLLAGGVALARGRASSARCEVDASPFAGVWDAERGAVVEKAFLSTGRPNAREAYGLLSARLDAFKAGWLEMQRDACESSFLTGAQPERVYALRSQCLQHKLKGFAALVEAFAQAGARVDRAAGVVPDPIQECADVRALTGNADALPADPAQRAAIDDIVSGVAVVSAEIVADRNATARARQLHEAALALGHTPTIALTLSAVARAVSAGQRSDDQNVEVKKILADVMRLAAQVGDRDLLAMSASYHLSKIAFREHRIDEADAMLPMVDALVNQAGNHPEPRLEVLIAQGAILRHRGKYLAAIEVFERAAALSHEVQSHRKTYGSLALGQIGDCYVELGRYPEAVRSRRAELDGIRSFHGALHPRTLMSTFNLGLVEVQSGFLDDARATAARLRELVAQLMTANDWRRATIPFLEGNIAERSGDCAAAIPLYRATLPPVLAYYGSEHAIPSDVYEHLGTCLHATGQDGEAIAQLEHGLAVRRALAELPKIAQIAFQLAEVLWERRPSERGRAIELAKESVSIWRRGDATEAGAAAERWLEARTGLALESKR
jgi:tetratricopeptide (TPR) repeat protein